ncbi:hypothetical protein [Azonexus hydrophilus]|uniref:Uncharacterized protein n=1 Tax=Azonexus hydrophilus TaxID=418702 RepID=A0ABZ2XDM9_9RHOO|nr:hypothetical protein [Azonexus hydrophilus]
MLITAALTLLAVLTAASLAAVGVGTPAAVAHLVFAVGIVPLIFAAMTHFVPVLTRTGDAPAIIRCLPVFAQLAGVLLVLALQGIFPYELLQLAAAIDLALAGGLLYWIVRRARAALGRPHPGWRWYAAALAVLMLALVAILAMALWPAHWQIWRLLHLHLNTLGLVGLAAFGTLPVLLPTVLGRGDPGAAQWLQRYLWPMLLAVLTLVLGIAVHWSLAAVGASVLLVLAGLLLVRWLQCFGWPRLPGDGAAVSLIAAVLGWMLGLLAGVLHGGGAMPAMPGLWAWVAAFLLPLVTGALSQLLPVWRWPGRQSPERDAMRSRLVARGALRAGFFLLAGAAFLGGFVLPGMILAMLGLLLFIVSVLQTVRIRQSTR